MTGKWSMTGRLNALCSIVLVLTSENEATISATAGHQAHAAFLAAIRAVDPALAAALHSAEVPVRPFTVSPLLGVGRARGGQVVLSPAAEYHLRFTALYPPVYERFMARFLRSDGRPLVRLGAAELLVKEVRTTPGSHPWAGYSTWQGLAAGARAEERVSLEFASPTAFGFGQRAWGKQVVVLPEPKLVFGSLARTWNALAPAPLAVDRQALGSYLQEQTVVTRIEGLRTQMLHYQRSQVGFAGRVSYGLMGENEIARVQLNMLADFAFYAGVGMKTTMGMGQCRRVPLAAGVRGLAV